MKHEEVVETIQQALLTGEIQPWKAEQAALDLGIPAPEHLRVGVLARRAMLEAKSGYRFHHLGLPDEPYQVNYRCPQDGTQWSLAAGDEHTRCGMCDSALELLPEDQGRYQPLVLNYLGGVEDYFSYAGEVTVTGAVDKTFQNILCWGTGIGHLGVSVGCFQLNRYGPIEVMVSEWGVAARNLSFVFDREDERERAKKLIQEHLPEILPAITEAELVRWEGEVFEVEFLYKQHHADRILHCTFYTRFREHRGHGQTSHAVGMAKNRIDELFREHDLHCRVSVVGMGRDGDLKPSPRNRRGR